MSFTNIYCEDIEQEEEWISPIDLISLLLIMIINPVVSVILAIYKSLSSTEIKQIVLFAVILAIYASGINVTKIPVSDQEAYLEQFYRVRQVGFLQTLEFGGNGSIREPLYGIYVYVCNYLLFGNAKLFFFLTSFLSLFFHYMAMIRIGRKYYYEHYIVVAGILSLTFFTQFYGLTLHLIRQLLASGIIFYAISLKMEDSSNYRRYLPYMIIAALTHSTAIFLILLSFLPKINEEFSFKNLLYYILFTAIFTYLFPIVSAFISGGEDAGFATYAFSRAMNADGLSDSADGATMNRVILGIITIPLSFISLLCYFKNREYVPTIFVNICLIMCLFVWLVSYSPLIQYRYFFYLYSFILFVFPILFRPGTSESKFYCTFLSIFMVLRFFITLPSNAYRYGDVLDLLVDPFPLLFLINPY